MQITSLSPRWRRFVGAAAIVAAPSTHALVLDHNLAFGAFNQSPFETGKVFDKTERTFIGPQWTDSPLSLVIPPGCPLELCLRPNLKTSGAFGAELGYSLSGGKLNFGYPMDAKVTLPNSVLAGSTFTVTIDTGLKSDGFGFARATLDANPLLAPWVPLITPGAPTVKHVPFLNTTFPSFAAWLDLVARFDGSINLRGTAPIVGTGEIFSAKLPGFDATLNLFRFDQSGISTDLPLPGGGNSIPFGTKIPVVPGAPGQADILTATFLYPEINTSGALDGSMLRASGEARVADLDLNVLQLLGLGFPILQLLEKDIPIGIGNIHYSLLKVVAGLSADLRQDFSLSASIVPTITFDTPLSVIDASGSRSDPKNTFDLPQNGSLQFELPSRGSAKLEGQLGYKLVATVHNDTSMAIKGRLQAEALEAGIDVDIGIEIKQTIGPVIGPIGPEGTLFEFPIFDSSFDIGLNQILTKPFALDVAVPSRSLIHTRFGPVGTGVLVSYGFRERCGELLCSPEEVTVLGFESTDAFGGTVFQAIDDIVFTSGGTGAPPRSYGRLYCVSCVDADLAVAATSTEFVIDGGGEAYINDYLLIPPTGADCGSCLDAFLAAHTGVSSAVETPLVVEFDQSRQFFFPNGTGVPVSGTSSLLALGLLLLTATRSRFQNG